MKKYSLAEITTQDRLVHQGMYFEPLKKVETALLWVHGLSGKFYGNAVIIDQFASVCEKRGWGFASFNNRGHDQIASIHKVDHTRPSGFSYVSGGAGYETFEECIFDIHAAVNFLAAQGFSKIYLVGHSTGALKVGYAEGVQPHPQVAGIILAGGVLDRLGPDINHTKLDENIARMKKIVEEGNGDKLVEGLAFFPMTPKRFLSLYTKGSKEEVFGYGDEEPKMEVFKQIKKPVFVIVSEHDEYLDRPAKDVIDTFDKHHASAQYKGFVFPDADHGFTGKESEFATVVSDWVTEVS